MVLKDIDDIKANSIIDQNDCWNWSHCLNDRGYGLAQYNGKTTKVHRISYSISNNKILTPDIFILHKCDNPACINPDHLFEGNQVDNVKDRVEKNRSAKGENHGMSKLTQSQVDEIRISYTPRKVSQRYLAKKYGVHQALIFHILKRNIWK